MTCSISHPYIAIVIGDYHIVSCISTTYVQSYFMYCPENCLFPQQCLETFSKLVLQRPTTYSTGIENTSKGTSKEISSGLPLSVPESAVSTLPLHPLLSQVREALTFGSGTFQKNCGSKTHQNLLSFESLKLSLPY